MVISRRRFLALCGASSSALFMGKALAALPDGTTRVIWLQGSGCTGCSVSFLNYISDDYPRTAADVLLDIVELDYHTSVMALAGDPSLAKAKEVAQEGGFVLVVEGGVPTAAGGVACWLGTLGGREYTFQEAVRYFADRAAAIICMGNCAAFGGVAAAPPNPTKIRNVSEIVGRPTINIAGCPPHPDWFVYVVAQYLAGAAIPLDSYGRPTAIFGRKIHDTCPRKGKGEASTYGVDNRCLKKLGCLGPETRATCMNNIWNGGVNWCVDANAPCIGCTEPNFPRLGMMKESEK